MASRFRGPLRLSPSHASSFARGRVLALLPAVLLLSTWASAQTTVTFQDGVSPSPSYAGTRDLVLLRPDGATYWDRTANYSTGPLRADGFPSRQSALLRWELSSLAPGSTVTAASITLQMTNGTAAVFGLYELLVPWDVNQVTYMRASSSLPWSVAGAHDFATDLSSTQVGTMTGAVGTVTVTLDAAGLAMLQRWIDTPANNFGLIIQNYDADNGVTLSSAEDAVASNRPRLTLTYGGLTYDFQQGVLPDASYSGMTDATIAEGPQGGENMNGHGLALGGGGEDSTILLAFDISSIPSNAIITDVQVALGVVNPSTDSYALYEGLQPWSEPAATWTSTGTVPWGAPGAAGGGTDHGAAVLGEVTPLALGLERVGLTPAGIQLVQDWVSGRKPNHGFVIYNHASSPDASLFLGRFGVPTNNRPRLRITYSMPPAPVQEAQEGPGLGSPRARPAVTLLGNGQLLLTGGASPEVYDPVTHVALPTSGGPVDLQGHSATVLFDGRVLVAGGTLQGQAVSFFQPETLAFSAGPPLLEGRSAHSATRLLFGEVLVAGGRSGAGTPLASAELYEPASGVWRPLMPMMTARAGHCALPLDDGRVVVVGGEDPTGPVASIEVFDPLSGTWSVAPAQLGVPRTEQACVRLADGSILIAGGAAAGVPLRAVERLSADLQSITPEPDLSSARRGLAAVVLPSNRVLVVGGYGEDGAAQGSSELGSPVTAGGWTAGPALTMGRAHLAAAMLANGKSVLVGGETAPGVASDALSLMDIFEPTLTPGPQLRAGGQGSASVRLPDGDTLVFGGIGNVEVSRIDARGSTVSLAGSTLFPHKRVRAVLLHDGKVLLFGHMTAVPTWHHNTELFDPATGTSTALPSASGAQWVSQLVRLPTDEVLALSGTVVERFVPWLGTWSLGTPMAHVRAEATGVVLPDGRVLVAGGWGDGGSNVVTSELWSAAGDAWTDTGSLSQGRLNHTSAVLPDGRVWAVGGMVQAGDLLSSTELYHPATGTWTAGPTLPDEVRAPSLTTLPSGKMAATPGTSDLLVVFDPVRNTLRAMEPVTSAGDESGTRLLPDGRLLLVTAHSLTYLFDEGYGRAWTPTFEPECTEAHAGRTLRFSGSSMVDEGLASASSELPVVMLHNLESQHLRALPTRLLASSAGEVELPAVLPNGRYALWVVSHGVASQARQLRVGTPPGGACVVDAHCGGGACVGGLCAGSGCTLNSAFDSTVPQRSALIPGLPPPGDEGPLEETLSPLRLKLACGCGAGGEAGLLVGLLVLISLARRQSRSPSSKSPELL